MNESICSENSKSESCKDKNEENDQSFYSPYYCKTTETFTILRQEESHNCFKDGIIIDLENDLACMKSRFTESINLFQCRKSAYLKGDLEDTNLRNSLIINVNCVDSNVSGNEADFFRKELEATVDLIENLKNAHTKKLMELNAHIKNTEFVLEDTINELGSAQDLLEVRLIEITQLNKRIKESDKLVQHLKDEIEVLKKTIKKKEMVENDLILSEEKSRQISQKLVELSSLLRIKEEELLKLKDKDKRCPNPKIKHKHSAGTKREILESPGKIVKLNAVSKSKSILEELLIAEDEIEDDEAQPKLERIRWLATSNKRINHSVEDMQSNTKDLNMKVEFDEMMNQDDEYTGLLVSREENSFAKNTICEVISFFIVAQIQHAAARRLNTLEQLQRNSINKSSYLSAIYPFQIETMNSLIKYLNKDLEDLKSENEMLRINYENKILDLEDRYLTKLSITRCSLKSNCSTTGSDCNKLI